MNNMIDLNMRSGRYCHALSLMKEGAMYEFRGRSIPKRMMPSIDRYIKHGVIPGRFLQAVICNNLHNAFSYADDENLENIAAYVGYFYNEVPCNAWGSNERMLKWAEDGGVLGGE